MFTCSQFVKGKYPIWLGFKAHLCSVCAFLSHWNVCVIVIGQILGPDRGFGPCFCHEPWELQHGGTWKAKWLIPTATFLPENFTWNSQCPGGGLERLGRDGLTFINEAAFLQAAAVFPSAAPGNLGQFSQLLRRGLIWGEKDSGCGGVWGGIFHRGLFLSGGICTRPFSTFPLFLHVLPHLLGWKACLPLRQLFLGSEVTAVTARAALLL